MTLFKVQKAYALVLALLVSFFAISADARTTNPAPPTNSPDFHFRGNQLILTPGSNAQHVYLFVNNSSVPLIVNHPKTSPGMGAGWMTQMDPQHGSALVINSNNFNITCAMQLANGNTPVLCDKVLYVRSVPQAIIPPNLQNGAFWAANNEQRDNLISAVQKRGIKLIGVSG